jgi:hypothetical protein
MSVLMWIVTFFFIVWLFFRFFGRHVIRYVFRSVLKRVAKDVENQARAYQQNYEQDPYHENIHINDDVKVKAPKQPDKRKVHPDEIAEDVDFEEVDK